MLRSPNVDFIDLNQAPGLCAGTYFKRVINIQTRKCLVGVASGCGCTPGQDPAQITLPAPGFQAGWRDGTGAGVCEEVPGAGRVCSKQGGFVRSLASTWVVGAEKKGGLGTSITPF